MYAHMNLTCIARKTSHVSPIKQAETPLATGTVYTLEIPAGRRLHAAMGVLRAPLLIKLSGLVPFSFTFKQEASPVCPLNCIAVTAADVTASVPLGVL